MPQVNGCSQCGGPLETYDEGTISVKDYFSRERAYAIAAGESALRLPIFVCQQCGHGQTPIEIEPERISQWYASDEPDGAFIRSEPARRVTARMVLERTRKHLGKKGSLIDVGAGPGIFVSEANKQGWQAEGVEPATWGVNHARQAYNISLKQGGFELLEKLSPGTYDAVTMFDVIEHVVSPKELLKNAARVTKKNGLLVLTTPRFDSLLARTMSHKWYCILPAHIHYFTQRSLRHALKEAGFEVIEERNHSRHLPLNYLAQRAMQMLGLTNFTFKRFPIDTSSWIIPINLGDEFEVYARKR